MGVRPISAQGSGGPSLNKFKSPDQSTIRGVPDSSTGNDRDLDDVEDSDIMEMEDEYEMEQELARLTAKLERFKGHEK